MPLIILLLILGVAFYLAGVWATLKFIAIALAVIAVGAAIMLGALSVRDIVRVLRFRLSIKDNQGYVGALFSSADLYREFSTLSRSFQKHTAEERRDIRGYAYHPSASIEKLYAFLLIMHREESFYLTRWSWRMWWRGCVRAAEISKSYEIKALARSQSEQNLDKLAESDLPLLMSLYEEQERDNIRLRWAQSSYQRARLAELRSLAEKQTDTGESALYSLLVYYVSKKDHERSFEHFKRYKNHPRANKLAQAEQTLKPLFTPTIGELNSALGRSWVYLENAERASWRLCPLEIENPNPGWLDAPAFILSQAKAAAPMKQGSYRIYKLPFTKDKVGLIKTPKRVGATVLITEAEPIDFPRWSECFDAPRPPQHKEDREQNNRIDAVLSLTESSALVWAVDKETRAPLAKQEVTFFCRRNSNTQEITEYKALTNDQGVAELSELPSYWQMAAKILRQDGPIRECLYLTHASDVSTRGNPTTKSRYYVVLPRPLYKPGETLKGAVVLRTKSGEDPSISGAFLSAMLVVHNPKRAELTRLSLSFSKLGTAEFTITLPAEAALGRYSFAFTHHQSEAELEGSFYVEEFVAPEFRASLSATPAKWGERMLLSFDATYFFGGPVANAIGTLALERTDWRYDRQSWPPYKRNQRATRLDSLPFKTDATGKAEIKIPWRGPSLFSLVDGCTFQAKARLRDASGKSCDASLSISVSRIGALLKATPSKNLCLPGEEVPFSLHWHRESSATPWPSQVTLKFGGLFGEKRVLEVQPEQATIQIKVPSKPKLWSLSTRSKAGDLHAEELYVLGASLSKSEMPLIVTSEPRAEGEPVRVALLGAKKATCDSIFVNYNCGPRLSSKVLPWTGGALWTDLETTSGDAPSLHVRCWFINKRRELESRQTSFALEARERQEVKGLPVSLSFPTSNYSPGEETALHVESTFEGEATLYCSVVDESLFSLVSAPISPLAFFERPAPRPETKMAWSESWSNAQSRNQRMPYARGHMLDMEESLAGGGAPPPMLSAAPPMPMPMVAAAAPAMFEMMPQRKSAGFSLPSFDLEFSRGAAPAAKKMAPGPNAARPAPPPPEAPPIEVRSDFSSEAAWHAGIALRSEQTLPLAVKFSDSLTSWRASALVITPSALGLAETSTKTQKPLMIRLQAPRFLQERDSFSLQAIIDSRTEEQVINASIETQGLQIEGTLHTQKNLKNGEQIKLAGQVTVLPSEKRELTLRAKAWSNADNSISDAEERKLPYRQYGSPLQRFYRGVITEGDPLLFQLPEERRREYTRLSLSFDRGPLDAVLRSLQYLLEYPYGCVEQTCSRFIPHLVWQRITEKKFNKSATSDPYRGVEVIPNELVESSLARLLSMQNKDGSFGWWSRGSANLWMTSYVAFCFALAGRSAPPHILEFMQQNILRATNPDDTDAFAIFALSWSGVTIEERAFTILIERWSNLSTGERAKLCWALLANHHSEAKPRLQSLIKDLLPGVKKFIRKAERDTFWLRPIATEAISFLVMAMIKASDASLQRELQLFISALLLHRKANTWHSTRDTALAVLALLLYEESLGEGAQHATLQIVVNQQEKAQLALEGLSKDPPKITMYDDDLKSGENELRFVTSGLAEGSIAQPKHYSVALSYFSTEANIAATMQGIELERTYWLVDSAGRDAKKLASGEAVAVGQRLRVELTITPSKSLLYLLVEDPKLAGFDTVAKKSGPEVCKGACSHVELRADRTAIFFDSLASTPRVVSYEVEAQIPGTFTVMPARVETMYDDEHFASTESFVLRVQ